MAKIKRIWNVSPGILGLPNGTEIAPGECVAIPAEFAENAGIQSWIADGLASTEEPVRVTVSVTANEALAEAEAAKAERDAALAELERVKAELAALQPQK